MNILKELILNIKELRKDMNSHADSLRKEIENVRRSQEKLEKNIYRDANRAKGNNEQNE